MKIANDKLGPSSPLWRFALPRHLRRTKNRTDVADRSQCSAAALDTTPTGGYANKPPVGAARGVDDAVSMPSPTIRRRSRRTTNTLAGSRAVHSWIAAAHSQYFRPLDFAFATRANDSRHDGADDPDRRIRGQRQPEFRSHLERVSLLHGLQRRRNVQPGITARHRAFLARSSRTINFTI